MHLGEQAPPDSPTPLVFLPLSRDASSVEEGTLLTGDRFLSRSPSSCASFHLGPSNKVSNPKLDDQLNTTVHRKNTSQ